MVCEKLKAKGIGPEEVTMVDAKDAYIELKEAQGWTPRRGGLARGGQVTNHGITWDRCNNITDLYYDDPSYR